MKLSEIKAQEAAVKALLSSISKGSVTHAYLFSGPKSVGKTSTALAFAAALNCLSRTPEGDSCGLCPSCLRIAAGSDADVLVIRPDGNQTKIDQMQEMIRELTFAPLSGRYKICIIEQADTLNSSSENSILKILEEPPHYAVLILLSRNPNSLLPTIRSRCRSIRFKRASSEEVVEALQSGFDRDIDELRTIAACSQGTIGRAYELASNPRFMEERRSVLHALKNWAHGPAVLSLQTAEIMREMAKPPKNNLEGQTTVKNLSSMLEHILAWYSDLLKVKVCGADADVINLDFADELVDQSKLYTIPRLRDAVHSIIDSRRYLEGNITPQLVLENLFLSIHPKSS